MTNPAGTKSMTFLTQSLGRTGSEVVLLHLLRHLDPGIRAKVLCLYPGTNRSQLPPEISSAFILPYAPGQSRFNDSLNRLKKKFKLNSVLRSYADSTWYINTIVLPDMVAYAERHNIPVILHVHELEQMYKLLTKEQLERMVRYPQWIIANSKASAAVLEQYGRKDRISVCYPAIDTTLIRKDALRYEQIRKELGIEKGTFVWLMGGTLDENKNPALFLDLANRIRKERKDVKFVWITQGVGKETIDLWKKRTQDAGLAQTVLWIHNAEERYRDYFNTADGFVLTSTRESFSLVTLEALLLGLPVVANDCGGVNELLDGKYGQVINGTDRPAGMAEAMLKYMDRTFEPDPELLRKRGEEFDIRKISSGWNTLLLKLISTSR